MSHLQITLFGTFQVKPVDQSPMQSPPQPALHFPTNKVKALLAYLAVEKENAHPRDKLMALFWPEQNTHHASNNLRQTLSRLRQTLAFDLLQADALQIQWKATRETVIDVNRFVDHLHAYKQHRHLHRHSDLTTCNECQTHIQQAIDLYQGDFLQNLSLADCAEFEEWVLLKREWLRSEVLHLLDQQTLIQEQLGNFEAAIASARRQLELDSLREEAWQQLMRNLALRGQRSEALASFDRCQKLLADELGVQPAQTTLTLAQQIREGTINQEAGTSRTATAHLPANKQSETQPPVIKHPVNKPLPCNVPATLTELIGRKQELDQLATLLTKPSARIITLLGPGGIGKTHLALAIAQQIAQNPTAQIQQAFQDGIYWVALSAIPTPDRIVEAIAKSLPLALNNYQEPAQQLQTWLRPKHLLLLLDNFEHLTEGVDQVVELLQTAPHLKILTTSRTRLQLQGEHLLPLDGLHYPHQPIPSSLLLPPTVLEEWSRYDAVQLFVQQAQRSQPDFRLQASDIQMIVAICQMVQGMPLAILLAAGWVNEVALSDIAEQIQRNIDFLTQDWRDLPARQRTMRAVLDRTWQLLSSHEQQILQAASIFRAGFTNEAAEKVMGASLGDLAMLVGKSMVQHRANGRYAMHELLRQYAAEKLEQSTEQSSAVRAAYMHYFAERLSVTQSDEELSEQAKSLLLDIENIHLAWQYLLQHGNFELITTARKMYVFLAATNYSSEFCYKILHQFADYLEKLIKEQPLLFAAHQRLVWTLIGIANYLGDKGQQDEMEKLFRRSHQVIQGPAYSPEESLHSCALAWAEEGRMSVHSRPLYARTLYEKSLPIFQQFSNLDWYLGTQTLLANLECHLGDYEKAEQTLKTILNDVKQLAFRDPYDPAGEQRVLAFALFRQGKFQTADALNREHLSIAEKTMLPSHIGGALPLLGETLFWCGKEEESQTIITRRLVEYAQVGVLGQTADAQRTQATIYLHIGDYEQASLYCQQAIDSQRMVRNFFALGASLVILAQIRLGQGRLDEARQVLDECITRYQELGEHGVIGSAYATLGLLCWQQGKTTEAKQQLFTALQIAHRWRAFFAALYALPVWVLIKVANGKVHQAVELYALVAAQTPVVVRSAWFETMVGHKLAAAQASLPSLLITRARKKGEEADIWESVRQVYDELQAELATELTVNQFTV